MNGPYRRRTRLTRYRRRVHLKKERIATSVIRPSIVHTILFSNVFHQWNTSRVNGRNECVCEVGVTWRSSVLIFDKVLATEQIEPDGVGWLVGWLVSGSDGLMV